jgi:hypothetical protein
MKSFLAAVLFLLSMQLLAQNKIPSAADRSASLTDWMKTNLKLTDDQVPKVQDINVKYANMVDALRSSSQGKKQKMTTLKNYDASKDKELKEVLTDDQFKTYLAKKDEVKKKFKEKMKSRKQSA